MDEGHDKAMEATRDEPVRWTQDEAIAFEAARDCITHLLAIRLAQHRELESLGGPVTRERASLDAEIQRLLDERRGLRLKDHAEIARVRKEYGAMVRQSREAAA